MEVNSACARRWLLGLVALLAQACSAETVPRTQLMLVADTNVGFDRIKSFEFHVLGPDGREETVPGTIDRTNPPPRTLGLAHEGGDLGPFRVSARMTVSDRGGDVELVRTHAVSFIKGKTLVVPLHLAERCLNNTSCGAGEVCTESSCLSVELDGSDLPVWDGKPPRVFGEGPDGGIDGGNGGGTGDGGSGGTGDAAAPVDGGTPDAGDPAKDGSTPLPDAAPPSTCEGGITPNFDIDVNHCGGCFKACPAPSNNATSVDCQAGKCVVNGCADLYGDCDGDADNGCERDLTNDNYCGSCTRKCPGNRSCNDQGQCCTSIGQCS